MKKDMITLTCFIGFLMVFKVLDWLHIPLGTAFLVLLGIALWLILFVPKPFAEFLDRITPSVKNPETLGDDFGTIARIIVVLAAQRIHDRFWSYITGYYPFSLLYRDRLFHRANRGLRSFIIELEAYAQTVHLPCAVRSVDITGAMTRFWAQQSGGKNTKKEMYIQQLQEKLQAKYDTIYLHPKKNGFMIHVPTSMATQPQATS